mmetsp:Transcript_13936/g.38046  ORF Transcript_13936/g.38046 Transcript_13936/m.38046 type:complete len:359 (-) Transcript_13936:49-1125(-)
MYAAGVPMFEGSPVHDGAMPNLLGAKPSQRIGFAVLGVALLMLICVLPLRNAVTLLEDDNYVFWAGKLAPLLLIFQIITLVVVGAVTTIVFSRRAKTEQAVMNIASIFSTLFGLLLILNSLPLSRQSLTIHDNLMYSCDMSDQTLRLFEYSQVLHNIRGSPDCADKYSVKDCTGYEDAEPYTSFLKVMEDKFRCSGFCYRPPGVVASQTTPGLAAPTEDNASSGSNLFLRHRRASKKKRHADHVTRIALLATVSAEWRSRLLRKRGDSADSARNRTVSSDQAAIWHPPTLFSDAGFRASCDGMAARDIKNLAGDIAFQTFFQGVYLVFIAITIAFAKLLSLCFQHDGKQTALRAATWH